MSYISTAEVKEIRTELKKTFPNVKFSIVREHYSKINVTILEAPINLLNDKTRTYENVNYFYIDRTYTGESLDLLSKVYEIMSRNNRTISEDSDYGNIPNYYMGLEIGTWNRPFVVKTK